MKEAVIRVLNSGSFVRGEETKRFEEEFAKWHGVRYAISSSSGTAALHVALIACGIKEGDEVITVAHTFVATVSTILSVGAKPVFVDVDPRYYTMDPEEVRKRISKRTKAILPVHLYGHPVDMKPILELAQKHGIYVVEDSCQAHGARYEGRLVGTLGHLGCFSFYPTKNMTVCGEGGMVITNDEELAARIRRLADHGRRSKDEFVELGYNYRLSELGSAIGRIQLKHLDKWVKKRRELAQLYSSLLSSLDDINVPEEAGWAYHSYTLYVCKAKERDRLKDYLADQGIETGIYYPIPVHRQPLLLSHRLKMKPLPVTERLAQEVIALPMHPSLSLEDLTFVANSVKSFYGRV